MTSGVGHGRGKSLVVGTINWSRIFSMTSEMFICLIVWTSGLHPWLQMFVPRKVNVFLWRFRLDSLPVRWLISAKGIDIHSIVCPVCNNEVETRDHLFFGCTLALDLWRRLRMWLNCAMPNFSSWDTFIVWIEGVHLSNIQKKRVIAYMVTLLWAMWRYRNGVVFNDVFCNRNSLFDLIRLLCFRWIKNRGHLVSNWNSWLAIPL
ncbi:uncharacterized protein [Rutidosis leptorrhynchoides]|uniref:uncharacterized protein n=1 Tax=Rutidosis leptorrhynchoides TaxID=125765 RepID=UPI003A99C7A9